MTPILIGLFACVKKNNGEPRVYEDYPLGNTMWSTVMDSDSLWVNLIMEEGAKWIGKPYLYGGVGPDSLDCSALMQVIFKNSLDMKLPRRALWQSSLGWPVAIEQLQKGDLVFFATEGNAIDHVGLYWGNHLFLNATVSRGVVLSSLHDSYWSARVRWGRRLRFGSLRLDIIQ